MPRQARAEVPDGWQIAQRGIPLRHYLQQRQHDGSWRDAGGPYAQRYGAVFRLHTLQEKKKEQSAHGQK